MSNSVFVTFTFLHSTIHPKLWQFLIGRTHRILCLCVRVCVCVCVHVVYGKYHGLNICDPYNLYVVAVISNVRLFGGGVLGR